VPLRGLCFRAGGRTNASAPYVSVALAEMEKQVPFDRLRQALHSAVAFAPAPVGMTGFFAPSFVHLVI
jgi:hypothetical protein